METYTWLPIYLWSLALRRDTRAEGAEVQALRTALARNQSVVTTGLILQELLQAFSGPRARGQIIEKFSALPLIPADRQVIQLCARHDLIMLTTDHDFALAAKHCNFRVWQ